MTTQQTFQSAVAEIEKIKDGVRQQLLTELIEEVEKKRIHLPVETELGRGYKRGNNETLDSIIHLLKSKL